MHGARNVSLPPSLPPSLCSVHTGIQFYNSSLPKIPTACITVEDAEMFDRFTICTFIQYIDVCMLIQYIDVCMLIQYIDVCMLIQYIDVCTSYTVH